MELSKAAQLELRIHKDMELGRNHLSNVAKQEIQTYWNIELGKYFKDPRTQLEIQRDIRQGKYYKKSEDIPYSPI